MLITLCLASMFTFSLNASAQDIAALIKIHRAFHRIAEQARMQQLFEKLKAMIETNILETIALETKLHSQKADTSKKNPQELLDDKLKIFFETLDELPKEDASFTPKQAEMLANDLLVYARHISQFHQTAFKKYYARRPLSVTWHQFAISVQKDYDYIQELILNISPAAVAVRETLDGSLFALAIQAVDTSDEQLNELPTNPPPKKIQQQINRLRKFINELRLPTKRYESSEEQATKTLQIKLKFFLDKVIPMISALQAPPTHLSEQLALLNRDLKSLQVVLKEKNLIIEERLPSPEANEPPREKQESSGAGGILD